MLYCSAKNKLINLLENVASTDIVDATPSESKQPNKHVGDSSCNA